MKEEKNEPRKSIEDFTAVFEGKSIKRYASVRPVASGSFYNEILFSFSGECLINVQELRFGGTKGGRKLIN